MGAGALDAEEIKSHSWFENIKWEDVLARKLCPPKPIIKMPAMMAEVPTSFQAQNTIKDSERIEGWSFVQPSHS